MSNLKKTKDGVLWIKEVKNRVGINKKFPQYDLDVIGNINFTGNITRDGTIYQGIVWLNGPNNSIYYNAGNVGIGTDTPVQLLNVNGNVNILDNYMVNNTVVLSSSNLGDNVYYSNLTTVGNLTSLTVVNNTYIGGSANIVGDLVVEGNITGNMGNIGNNVVINGTLQSLGNTILGSNSNTIIQLGNSNSLVGINTSTPAYTLDVTGNANITTNLLVGGNSNITGQLNTLGNSLISSNANTIILLGTSNSKVGINTSSPSFTLDVRGNANITSDIFVRSNSNITGRLNTFGNARISSNANTTILLGTTGSMIGINNSSPLYTLDVTGNTNITTDLQVGGNSNITGQLNTEGNSLISSNANTNILLGTSNSKVGINNSLPLYTLDITGNTNITTDLQVGGNALIMGPFISDGDSSIGANANTTILLGTIDSKVGINTSSPSYTLDVTGNANITTDLQIGGNTLVMGTFVTDGDSNIGANANTTILLGTTR